MISKKTYLYLFTLFSFCVSYAQTPRFIDNKGTITKLSDLVDVGHFIISYTDHSTTKEITLPFKPSKITFVAHANIGDVNINSGNDVPDFWSGNHNNAAGVHNTFGTMNGYAKTTSSGTIEQQVIFIGGHGNSINDISRYASNINCIGLRFTEQNGGNTGIIRASLASFFETPTNQGFRINVTYDDGEIDIDRPNPKLDIFPEHIQTRSVLVMYTAYR